MSEHVITADVDGREVGRLVIRTRELPYGQVVSGRYAEITYLEVEAEHRRRGIGTWLLGEAADWAREQGFDQVCVETAAANAGQPGLAFYRATGFTERLVLLDRAVADDTTSSGRHQPRRALPQIRLELLARARRDQHVRHADDDAGMERVDAQNLEWLAAVIDEHGWLDAELVGPDGAHACWLLCQHAPPQRQDEWLPLLRAAVERGTAERRDLAYLQDRVDSHHDRPQAHATQYVGFDGERPRLWPVTDPSAVNELRYPLGLPPVDQATLEQAWTWAELAARRGGPAAGPEQQ